MGQFRCTKQQGPAKPPYFPDHCIIYGLSFLKQVDTLVHRSAAVCPKYLIIPWFSPNDQELDPLFNCIQRSRIKSIIRLDGPFVHVRRNEMS